jgi:uncharacterized protein YciI
MPFLILLAGLAGAAPLPADWQTVYVVTQSRTSSGPVLSEDALRLLDTLQAQYAQKLRAEGKAVAGGVLDDGTTEPSSLLLICAESAAAARALADGDPRVQFGQVTTEVRAWRVPVGTIACPK